GRAILSLLPRAAVAAVAEAHGLGEEELQALLQRVEAVRRQGVDVSRAELIPGVVSVAAPVECRPRALVGAVSVCLPALRLEGRGLDRLRERVRATAATIQERLRLAAAGGLPSG
ncbi:MAG: hypothetical protein OWV35_11160, partial [Firmicutes bacterium]|nr:hypothetical protein [Bacillota bacterium]